MYLQSNAIRYLLDLIYLTRFHLVVRRKLQGVGCILFFHRVQPIQTNKRGFNPNIDLTVTPEFLNHCVRYFLNRGWDIINMDMAQQRLQEQQFDRPFVVFTFDDGYRDNIEFALPVMQHHGVPFTIYVTTGFIDGWYQPWWIIIAELIKKNEEIIIDEGNGRVCLSLSTSGRKNQVFKRIRHYIVSHNVNESQKMLEDLYRYYDIDPVERGRHLMLSWDEIDRLAEAGVEIGAHGVSHLPLSLLSTEKLQRELGESRRRLENRIVKKINHFCYPFGGKGDCGDREFDAVRCAGYQTAVTTCKAHLSTRHRNHLFCLPRLMVKGSQQHEKYLDLLISGVTGLIYHGYSGCAFKVKSG